LSATSPSSLPTRQPLPLCASNKGTHPERPSGADRRFRPCRNGTVQPGGNGFFSAGFSISSCPTTPLTLLECADPLYLLFHNQIAPLTLLESALTNASQLTENTATLSPAECAVTSIPPANPLECALTKNTGGGGPSSPTQNSPLDTCYSPLGTLLKFFLFTSLRTLLHSSKYQLFYFQAIPNSLPKTPGGGVLLFRRSAEKADPSASLGTREKTRRAG